MKGTILVLDPYDTIAMLESDAQADAREKRRLEEVISSLRLVINKQAIELKECKVFEDYLDKHHNEVVVAVMAKVRMGIK